MLIHQLQKTGCCWPGSRSRGESVRVLMVQVTRKNSVDFRLGKKGKAWFLTGRGGSVEQNRMEKKTEGGPERPAQKKGEERQKASQDYKRQTTIPRMDGDGATSPKKLAVWGQIVPPCTTRPSRLMTVENVGNCGKKEKWRRFKINRKRPEAGVFKGSHEGGAPWNISKNTCLG